MLQQFVQKPVYMPQALVSTTEKKLWDWAYEVNKQSVQLLEANGFELYDKIQNPELYKSAYEEYFVQRADLSPNPHDKETIWQGGYHLVPPHVVIRGFPH